MRLVGLTFCGLERLGGRFSTHLIGHGFMAGLGADVAIMLTSHPLAAADRRLKAGLPSIVDWVHLDLRAGLALDAGQAKAWNIDVDRDQPMLAVASTEVEDLRSPIPGEQACLGEMTACLLEADLDALVLPANKGGVHAIVVLKERYHPPWIEVVAPLRFDERVTDIDQALVRRYPSCSREGSRRSEGNRTKPVDCTVPNGCCQMPAATTSGHRGEGSFEGD